MALAAEAVAGVQQRHLRAAATEFGRIQIGGDIALDHPHGDITREFIEGDPQHRGLPRTRRTHQIQRPDSIGLERLPIDVGPNIVLGENLFQDIDTLRAGVIATVVASLMSVVVVV